MSQTRPYKVRKTFQDTKSGLSSYALLENAIAKAKENPGYNVYDGRNGKCVWQCQIPAPTKKLDKPLCEVVYFEEEETPKEEPKKIPWYKKLFGKK